VGLREIVLRFLMAPPIQHPSLDIWEIRITEWGQSLAKGITQGTLSHGAVSPVLSAIIARGSTFRGSVVHWTVEVFYAANATLPRHIEPKHSE